MRKFLLNKSRGKESVNTVNYIPVEINRDVSLFHDEILTDTVDVMQVYNDEKDKSTKHRFVFTLTPLCSNVLFNNITEIVYNEGATNAKMLTNNSNNGISCSSAISKQTLNRIHAIRNTEYSNEKFHLTYHCGVDIFNNHLLRSIENTPVVKRSTVSSSAKTKCNVFSYEKKTTTSIDAFNTIGDYVRTHSGADVITKFPSANSNYTYSSTVSATQPLYIYDTIYSFEDAYNSGLKKKDGWIGFYNPTSLRIPISGTSSNGYFVNKCINSAKGCQFIDMAPERDLFFFTPKKNSNRKRVEYNWDYCLTYPAESIYSGGNILNGKGNGLPLIPFGSNMYKDHVGGNGIETALFRSPVKHNLSVGDYVYLKFTDGTNVKVKVVSVGATDGRHMDRYFSVIKEDFTSIISDSAPERFSKVSNGIECEYYFRMFKKFNETFRSSLNKLAFASNIYGDEVSQIVFTDDINIKEYKDNRGRPLTEIYLTIVKRNSGYQKWYSENNCTDASIEYSHVFGEISSGLDMPTYAGRALPTLRFLHNINTTHANNNSDNVVFPEPSVKLEGNITMSGTSVFFGDLVEFNPSTLYETVLEEVKHRFNTAQRETLNANYANLYYDELEGDIYDGGKYGLSQMNNGNQFTEYIMHKGYANLAPEGYYYKPHHKVVIGEYSKTLKQLSDTRMRIVENSITANTSTDISFITEINYNLVVNDVVGLSHRQNYTFYQYRVSGYYLTEDGKYICHATLIDEFLQPEDSLTTEAYDFFKHNLEIPEFAYMIPDGTGRHLWRDILNPSTYTNDSELYNIPFTNGAFYHHSNIIFPIKRQDPFKTFGMYATKDGVQLEDSFEVPSNELDTTDDEIISGIKENRLCF